MPAATVTAPAGSVSRGDAPTRDPLPAHAITLATVLVLGLFVWLRRDAVSQAIVDEWRVLISWALLIGLVNLLPLRVEDFSLTLDLPLLLAIAMSVSPEAAAAVAFVATVDTREIGVSRIGFSRALFNRSQVALCVLLAGMTFHVVAPGLEPLAVAITATGLALLVDYLLNTGLVILHLSARRRMAISLAARKLTVGTARPFLATYLGFGIMALVLAHLYGQLGFWPVVAFLVPALIARQALLRDLHLQRATRRLVLQRRLLERALDRSAEEREDERRRVAGELHDEVLQCLFSLRMYAAAQASRSNTRKEKDEDSDLLEKVDFAIDRLRNVIGGLRNSPLGPGGLVPTLKALVRDSRLQWDSNIGLEVSGDVRLSGHRQVLLYQILREALLNALKHSQSPEITILLASDRNGTSAIVEDYGVGFEPHDSDELSHFGLQLMKERADRLGASLQIASFGGKGTRLSIAIPHDRESR